MIRHFAIALLTIALFGCNTRQLSHSPDPSFNFAAVTTYQIIPDRSGKESVAIHADLRKRISKVIDDRMLALGIARAYPQTPHIAVSYRLEAAWDPRLSPAEIKQREGLSGSRFPEADPRARDFQVLSFVIEMGSPALKKQVWIGRGVGVRHETGKSGAEVLDAAEEIMKQFPE
jgi:hypothetical protein